jgi:hypothetical protein
MRHAAALALFMFLLSAAGLCAQSFRPLQERLGDVVDAGEREYFGLFPGLEGFSSASLLAEGDSLRFVVRRSPGDVRIPARGAEDESDAPASATAGADSSIALSRREAMLLQRLVDSYESILQDYPAARDDIPGNPDRQELELRFGPLLQRGVLRLRSTAMNDVPRVALHLRNGGTVRGRMLFLGDDALAVRVAGLPYHWRSADSGIVLLPIGDIAGLTLSVPSRFKDHLGTGAFISMGLIMLVLSNISESGSHMSGGEYPLVDRPGLLLGIATVGGIFPSMLLAGILAAATSNPVEWTVDAMQSVWMSPADSKHYFACTGLPPPEWSEDSGRLDRALAAGASLAAPAGGAADETVSSSPSVGRRVAAVWSITADAGMNYYSSHNREAGAFGGASVAADLPLVAGDDGSPVLALLPRAGLGAWYLYGEASLRLPLSRRVSLLAGLAVKWMDEYFVSYCSLHPDIVQNGLPDYLFWHGGFRVEFTRSYLELRVGAPVNRIVVTSSDAGGTAWCWVPRPLGFVSAQLSLGWRL